MWVSPLLLIIDVRCGLHPAAFSASVCFNNREEVISAISQGPDMSAVSLGIFIPAYFYLNLHLFHFSTPKTGRTDRPLNRLIRINSPVTTDALMTN